MGQWDETAASIAAINKDRVYQDTWGHLAPKTNTTYRGVITCAKSHFESGRTQVLDIDLKGLESSPWLYEAVEDMLWQLDEKLKAGCAYVIQTTFRNYRFWTKLKEINLN